MEINLKSREHWKNAEEALEAEDTPFPGFIHDENEHIQEDITNSIKFYL